MYTDYLLAEDPDYVMPPKGHLSPTELSLIRVWIEEGADWPEDASVTVEEATNGDASPVGGAGGRSSNGSGRSRLGIPGVLPSSDGAFSDRTVSVRCFLCRSGFRLEIAGGPDSVGVSVAWGLHQPSWLRRWDSRLLMSEAMGPGRRSTWTAKSFGIAGAE